MTALETGDAGSACRLMPNHIDHPAALDSSVRKPVGLGRDFEIWQVPEIPRPAQAALGGSLPVAGI